MSQKYVYLFSEGNGSMRELLGGKGANLAEMTNLGLPVPQGFVVTTEACNKYYDDDQVMDQAVIDQIFANVAEIEALSGKQFGDASNPLLLSVRSGSRASMPGMMDTILNLGLNDEVVESLAKLSGNARFAYDSYRRFIQMFADVVMELPKHTFEVIIDEMKQERDIILDSEFTADDFKEMVRRFKAYYYENKKEDFPSDARFQLLESVKAVFRSWNNPRAEYYRRLNDIPSTWGTAVNIQMMVFGNMGDDCGTGVAFTRNPAPGENKLYGEFLMNAQGEDVVAGIRTPRDISELKGIMPEVYDEFQEICDKLEAHYKDMQDVEFTIESGKLYMLQTRSGKRTAAAALKIAVDLHEEGMLTKEEALLQINPAQLDSLLHPHFDPEALKAVEPIGKALPASPGAATGKVALTAESAVHMAEKGEKVVLVRLETSPEDIEGMHVSEGILTARGGMTSHAAVVARGMGTCCVAGCGDIKFLQDGSFELGGQHFKEGDDISLDGTTGFIYGQPILTEPASITGYFETVMSWADEFRRLDIRANADNPNDAQQAVDYGAQGIGLDRTEHMIYEGNRIKAMREMILSKNQEQRERALAKLLPIQRADFEALFETMRDLPITVRYLDPPLHEFLPTNGKDIEELAKEMDVEVHELESIIDSLHEFNPMMGHRGVRLAISYPEIAAMQTQAIIEAAIAVSKKHPEWKIVPDLMIPLVGEVRELTYVKEVVTETADAIIKRENSDLKYMVGTMIEIPRATLLADEVAKEAEFFSFGTNDLTQMTFGFSRDDAAGFLTHYYDKNILEQDPFARLDQSGVGQLVKLAVDRGLEGRPDLKLGVCGEHGGDPSSIDFFHRVGLDYVSCSPYRVPIARLAAAHAALNNK